MLSGEQVEDISNIDSCQATVTSKETIQTVTAYTTSTVVSTPVRRTFEEQKPFIFVIVGFAAFYIIALIIARIVKNQLAHLFQLYI